MSDELDDDLWSEYVANGQAFAGRIFAPGVVGQIPFAQLFNPVASGIRVRIRVLEPMTVFGFGLNHNVRRHDVALPTLGFFGVGENLLGGGVAPIAEPRTHNQVANLGVPFWLFLVAGNNRENYPPSAESWGHDLLPGQGIMSNGTGGGFVFVGYQWAEVPL